MRLTDEALIVRTIRAYTRAGVFRPRARGKVDPEYCSVERTEDSASVTLRNSAGVLAIYRYDATLNRLARIALNEPTPEEYVPALLARIATATA